MAIEIETKRTSKTSLLINILFYLSVVLLIGATVSFFAFNYLEGKTEEEIKNSEKELKRITEEEGKGVEERISLVETKTSDFEKIINSKKIASKALPYLEQISHPEVYFTSVKMGSKEANQFEISGKAKSYKALEQQLLILIEEEKINKYNLSNISEKEGRVNFKLSISVASNLFYSDK